MTTNSPTLRTPDHADRRSFLRTSFGAAVGAVGAVSAASAVALRPKLAFATPTNPALGDALIVIFLRGAADGLSMTPPIGSAYSSYAALRPTLAINPGQSLPLDSSNQNVIFPQGLDGIVGMHPSMISLYESVWASGHMAVMPASGLPDYESTTRSHFTAEEYWDRGSASRSVTTGFLTRVLAAQGSPGPVGGMSTTSNSNGMLVGALNSFDIGNVSRFGVNGFNNRNRAETALQAMYTGTGFVNTTGARTLDVAGLVSALDQSGLDFPETGIGNDMRDVATVLRSNLGLASAIVDYGGWDHHDDQAARFETNIRELSEAIRAFVDYLGPEGMAETTIAVVSEFGRTVDENGNAGTDHGRAGTTLLIGGNVQGGVFGNDYPDEIAEDPDNRRAFRVLTDYRQPLAEILAARMGITGMFPTKRTDDPILGVARA